MEVTKTVTITITDEEIKALKLEFGQMGSSGVKFSDYPTLLKINQKLKGV